jgi:glycosyltransferase involved in cell wall biosynthesis
MAALDPAEQEKRSAEQDRPLVVGITGRLAPWKGQDVFLRAFAQAFPGGAQRAVIVGAPLFGATETAYEERLRALVEELGIGHRVEFRGHRDDMGAELRAMDVLVHASTIPEPFGQVIVEGMAAHLAVVATRGGGPDEIVTDGVDGLLYDGGDLSALAAILVRLQDDPLLRAQLADAASKRAQDFTPAAVADKIMEAYELARNVTTPNRPSSARNAERRRASGSHP